MKNEGFRKDQQSVIFYSQMLPQPLTTFSSLRVLGDNKVRENSVKLTKLNFSTSSLSQSNCILRSNEKVNQTTCFNFAEMSRRWLRVGEYIIGTGIGSRGRK